jgi:hypothetical protein
VLTCEDAGPDGALCGKSDALNFFDARCRACYGRHPAEPSGRAGGVMTARRSPNECSTIGSLGLSNYRNGERVPVTVHYVPHHETTVEAPDTYEDAHNIQVADGHLFVTRGVTRGEEAIVAIFAPDRWHHAQVTK